VSGQIVLTKCFAAMPTIRRSCIACIAYVLRAVMLVAILSEAYTFFIPSSYSALWRDRDQCHLATVLVYSEEIIRFLVKGVKFWVSVHYTLLVFGIRWYLDEIDTTQNWGLVLCFVGPTKAIAFRLALPRDCWVAKCCIWNLDVLDRVIAWFDIAFVDIPDEVANWEGVEDN